MKNLFKLNYIFICLILTMPLFINSCKTIKPIKLSNEKVAAAYNESYQKWTKLKKTHNDSYEYAIGFSSWVGYSATTTIVVKNGKVISRTHAERTRGDKGRFSDKEMLVYSENESDINTNDHGAKGITIDQVYKDCGNISLQVDESENDIYFTADEEGVIRSCGYGLKNCSDDCSRGVYFSSFKWL